jgi:hypothetical protein
MSPLLDPPRTEKSARTRLDTKMTPGAPAETSAGWNNSAPASGDAMAEAFRRARLKGKIRRPQ